MTSMDANTILSLKVSDLQHKLRQLNLPHSGLKTVLQNRLLTFYGQDRNGRRLTEEQQDTVEQEEIEEEEETIEELEEEEPVFLDAEEGASENNKQPKTIKMAKPMASKPTFTLKDIRETISNFYGTGRPKVEQWIEEVEENAAIVNWNELQTFIYAKQLIKGAAQLWLRSQRNINSWAKLKTNLIHEFGNTFTQSEIHRKLSKMRKRMYETYLEFLYKIMEVAKPLELDDENIIDYFIEGIVDSRQNKSILYEATNLDELKRKIKVYEKIKRDDNRTTGLEENKRKQQFTKNKKCEMCPHLNNHSTEECKKANRLCFKCNKPGHRATDCRNSHTSQPNRYNNTNYYQNTDQNNYNRQNNAQNNYNNNNNQTNRNYNRNNTNQQQNNTPNNTQPNSSQNNPVYHAKFSYVPPQNIYKDIKIGDCTFQALFDTGSDLTLLTKSIFDKMGDLILFPNQINIHGLGQGTLKTLGYTIVTARMDDIEFNWRFHIVNDDDIYAQPILGVDILEILDVYISKNGAVFHLKEKQDPLEDMLFEEVLGKKSYNETFIAGREFRAICENEQSEIEIDFGPNTAQLSKLEETELRNLVQNYIPDKTEDTQVETKIILTDDIPVHQKPRRLAYTEQKFVESQVDEWLRDGIIKPSHSEYASPIVIVSKKDGSKRLCCDYRKLNDKTVKDHFPMVLIDDALSKLNANIFTTIDLKNAYFHVPVEEQSQKYTAFVTHHGQFEFLRTPFGITNAPAIFCRYIAAVFHTLIQNGTMIVYMDDIVIPSQTVNENLRKLTQVLDQARKHGLQINFKKCQFVQTKITFLGYIISNCTIQPSKDKIRAVMNFTEPTDIKTLQRFLGLTSYFRRFIRNYSFIAKPLTDLLPKCDKFKMNNEQRLAFEQLKNALTSSPVLKIFNPHALTEIHTDASKYGFGGALLQKDAEDQKWHPVEYMSRKTTRLEQKYHSYELEVLAIVNALKKWRYYLLGIHIKIVTDCHAFTQTVKNKNVPARIARYVIFLQDFDYEIEHRAGSRLKHVDALSRVYSLLIQSSLKHCIIEAQKNDEWTNTLRQLLTKENYKDFYLKGDIVYKDPNREQIVIPTSMEREIIELAHKQGHTSAKKTMDIVQKDFFIQNITEKVHKIVKSCIQCIVSDAKAGKKEGFLNPIDKTDRPLETFHIDHVGPLEKTQKQYNHILAIVDGFSKFIWLYPTKSTGSNEVINVLKKQSAIFGNPTKIITDKGTAFTSQSFQEYCQEQNIYHHTVTTGVPRGNGQIERMHKIVISLLTKLCTEKPQNWYKYIDKIQQTLNNTINRSTKNTPFKILTGIEMKTTGLTEIKDLLTNEEVEELQVNREEIRETARQNILEIQKENCRNFNKNRKKETEYQIGDLVAIKRTQFGTGLKIKPKYLGPYKVTKTKKLGRYEVERLDESEGPKKTTTIAEYMKPWNSEFGSNSVSG